MIFGETLSNTALAACAMILIGVLWVQLGSLLEGAAEELEPAQPSPMKPVSAG